MPVTTTRLVTQLFILVIHGSAPQLIRVIFEGDWAMVPNHWVPLGNNASVLDTLIVGGGAIVVSMVNAEAPLAVFPQRAVPLGVIRLLITTLEAVREGGPFVLVGLVFRNGMCF